MPLKNIPSSSPPPPANAAHPYFKFRIYPSFFAHLFKAVTQQHHQEMKGFFKSLIPQDGVVFDVGAHAGQFAKLFARLAPRGTVYAMEPGSYARAILRTAVACNFLSNIAVMPLALGTEPGIATLTIPVKKGGYGFGLSHLGTSDASRKSEAEIIPVTTLDALVASLNLTRLDFIKADIEGFELRFIEGARHTITRFRPALFLELDDRFLPRAGDSLQAAWQTLTQLGYRAYEPTETRVPLMQAHNGDVLWLPQ
jgi:FkbM family methyltransferase